MTEDEIVDKGLKVFKYFENKYGEERAMIICKKIAPVVKDYGLFEMIKVGEKWHYTNLLFNGKISNEEFAKGFDR